MWSKKYLSPIAGIAMAVCFFIFTLIALAVFSPPFDPVINWVSDIGGYVRNPEGAIFFNVGCILVGIAFCIYTMGIPQWKNSPGTQRNMVYTTLVAGYIASFSLMMVGVFSEDILLPHLIAAGMFYNPLCLFLALVGILTYGYRGIYRPLSISGLSIAIFVFIWNVLLHNPLLEFIAVILIISFFCLTGANMLSILIKESRKREK